MNKTQEQWEKEFDERFPLQMRELHFDEKGIGSTGVIIMNGVLKSYISYLLINTHNNAIEEAIRLVGRLLGTPYYNKKQTYDTGIKESLSVLNELKK